MLQREIHCFAAFSIIGIVGMCTIYIHLSLSSHSTFGCTLCISNGDQLSAILEHEKHCFAAFGILGISSLYTLYTLLSFSSQSQHVQ